jgi:hypothetical protein
VLSGKFNPEGPGTVEYYPIAEARDIAVAYLPVGSGRPLVDIYIFECSSSLCSLFALKRWVPVESSIEQPFIVEVDLGSGLSLRDNMSKLLLFASFDP